jgi:gliding motility-associated protein GldM
MSIPKEPRQLMINLMYLVLTALLALNVSNEILNAFKVINKSINRSNVSIAEKNDNMLANFASAATSTRYTADKKKRIAEGEVFAKQAHDKTLVMVGQIEKWRDQIVEASGGMIKKEGITDYKSPENLDAATHIMLPEGKNQAAAMRTALENYKREVAALVPINADSMVLANRNEDIEAALPIDFSVDKSESNPKADWATGSFHMVPTVGAVTIMDKYINDVRNSEGRIMEEIWARAFGETDIKTALNKNTTVNPPKVIKEFTKFTPFLNMKNNYVLPGETLQGTAVVGAYNDDDSKTLLNVNGKQYRMNKGLAEFSFPVSSTARGVQKFKVTGSYLNPNTNKTETLAPTEFEYFIGTPAASISLDKMNVFYIGVENPITLSASGVPMENIKVDGTSLDVRRDGTSLTKYTVIPTGAPYTKGYIELTGKRSDGVNENFGKFEFRIKPLPDPEMFFGGKKAGKIETGLAKIQLGPEPRVPPGFEWPIAYKVTEFVFEMSRKRDGLVVKREPCKGGLLTEAAQDLLRSAKPGDRVWLTDIIVVGPDKKPRNMPQMAYNLF